MPIPGPDVIRICKRCGEQYHPKSTRQQCCNKSIDVPCVVCGKLMSQKCTFAKQNRTCSKECSTLLGNIQRENTAKKLIRKCKWCGKEFHPKSSRDFYCNDIHYATCEVCGKQFEVRERYHAHNKTCSEECRYISAKRNTDMSLMTARMKSTMISRYGVDNAMRLPDSLDKMKATVRERYGVDWYVQTDDYKNKTKETCLDKYGVGHHLASKEVQNKRLKTVQAKFGVDNVFQSKEIKDKTKDTNLMKYGVTYISQSPEIHRRMYVNRANNVAKDGTMFDSSYERIFYDFLLQFDDIKIETQVPISFDYLGTSHTTLIDFRVNGVYFESKGSHLLNGVFDYMSQIPISVKLDVYRRNNVVIITDTDNDISKFFNDELIGIDIRLFDSDNDSMAVRDAVMRHISNHNGFLSKLLS